MLTEEYYMRKALSEAVLAYDTGESPIGAIIVANGKIIGKGHNQVELLRDPTAHAEMLAITAACEYLDAKYLTECDLYVTLEPCVMCAGAIKWAQINKLIYGASDKKFGYTQIMAKILHPKTHVIKGTLAEDSASLLKSFFKNKRNSIK